MKEKKWKNKNFFDAMKNSLNGILHVLKNERNIKIQLCFAIVVYIVSFILNLSNIEFAIITIVIFMVFFAEFMNTAIEELVDMYTLEYNEKAKVIKDVAAGAVIIVSIASVIVGFFVFLPKIIEFIK